MAYLRNLREVQRFEHLDLLARQVVEGFIVGLHKSPFHGFSVEFAEHRLYNPGESARTIDWKVFARTDRLYTKRFEEETNLRARIVIDGSSSMDYPSADAPVNKKRFSVLCAAALMVLLDRQRDACGLTIFDEAVRVHTRSGSSRTHQNLLFSHLDQLLDRDVERVGTDAVSSLHAIAERIPRRSLVILFSDMVQREDPDAVFDALQHFKYNKHEVMLFHVTDHATELELEFENRPHVFVDMETGEEVRVHPHQVRERYIEHSHRFFHQLKLRCGQYGIDLIEADIARDFHHVLLPYLLKRKRLM